MGLCIFSPRRGLSLNLTFLRLPSCRIYLSTPDINRLCDICYCIYFLPGVDCLFTPVTRFFPAAKFLFWWRSVYPYFRCLYWHHMWGSVSRVPSQRFTGLQASDMYSYLCLCVCVGKCHVCVGVPRMAEEGVGCSGTVVTGSYKLPDVGTENWTQGLWKSRECSPGTFYVCCFCFVCCIK